jgi:hypothetical protein
MTEEQTARLRITLEDIEPEIWRSVEVPLDMPLKSLHDVIQAAFGWQDYHLYEFQIGEKYYGIPDPDGPPWAPRIMNAKTTKLQTVVARGIEAFTYTYDFGDDWRHRVVVEAIGTAEPNTTYPRLLDGKRRGPPEDVGGVPGYFDFLDAVTTPGDPNGQSLLTWYGGPYDPDDIDTLTIRLRLGTIVKRRRAGKAAYDKRKS